jgi:hypothetical protein
MKTPTVKIPKSQEPIPISNLKPLKYGGMKKPKGKC